MRHVPATAMRQQQDDGEVFHSGKATTPEKRENAEHGKSC